MKEFFKKIGRGIWSIIKRGGAIIAGAGMVVGSWVFSTTVPAAESGISIWVTSGAVPTTVTIMNPWLLYPGLALMAIGFVIYMVYGREKKDKQLKQETPASQRETAPATA